jgi:hypothetical protein
MGLDDHLASGFGPDHVTASASGVWLSLDDRSTTTTETVMAAKRNVSISSGPTQHRLSSADRHAARVLEIAGQQQELKAEAAARRAKRALEAASGGGAPEAPVAGKRPRALRNGR